MQYIRGVGLDVVLRELRRVFKSPGAGRGNCIMRVGVRWEPCGNRRTRRSPLTRA